MNDTAMVEWATEIKVRAERRAGELLAAMEKHEGGRPTKTSDTQEQVSAPTLSQLGIDKKQSSRWQKLATEKSWHQSEFRVILSRRIRDHVDQG